MPQVLKNRAELLLVLLGTGDTGAVVGGAQAAVKGITRLEKLLFLLTHEMGFLQGAAEEDGFHFVPFRMGPWTNEVYDEVDFLESIGLLERQGSSQAPAADAEHNDELFSQTILEKYQKGASSPGEQMEEFSLTESGRKKALELWGQLSPADRTKIIDLKRRFARMDLQQLLRYVYKKFPDYTSESEIKEFLGLGSSG